MRELHFGRHGVFIQLASTRECTQRARSIAATMQRATLIFVPVPGMGHLVPTIRLAEQLASHDHRICIDILIMKLPIESEDYSSYLDSLTLDSSIKLVPLPPAYSSLEDVPGKHLAIFLSAFIEAHVPRVRAAAKELASDISDSPTLAGFVVDMFCTCMAEVAEEFDVPCYVFYTSSAAYLGLSLHVQAIRDESGVVLGEDVDGTEGELTSPCFLNPVPLRVMPSVWMGQSGVVEKFIGFARNLRKAEAILVNTCRELEPYALESLQNSMPRCPPVYAVGPLLKLPHERDPRGDVSTWLDKQPDYSVLFLCFGTYGSFRTEQVVEIAGGLERSGLRFLWSLRRPSESKLQPPTDYCDPAEVLPDGFLDRTAEVGRVIGWAPQTHVLAHKAIGGFVSHCGWNSTLESLWFGVPIATWPLYAEQQTNAFQLVTEMRMAVEITIDYRKDGDTVVGADKIANGITELMDTDIKIRRKVKDMQRRCRDAVTDGGSSHSSITQFVQLVLGEIDRHGRGGLRLKK